MSSRLPVDVKTNDTRAACLVGVDDLDLSKRGRHLGEMGENDLGPVQDAIPIASGRRGSVMCSTALSSSNEHQQAVLRGNRHFQLPINRSQILAGPHVADRSGVAF